MQGQTFGEFPFDDVRYTTLFHEDRTEAELAHILEPFDHSDEIARRIMAVRARIVGGYLPATDDELLTLAAGDLALRRALCDLAGDAELVGILTAAEPRFEPDRDVHRTIVLGNRKSGDTPHGWVMERIGDLVHERTLDDSPASHALFEALYGLRNSFELQWYCAAPLVALDGIDLTPLFTFWSHGGALALDHGRALVRRKR